MQGVIYTNLMALRSRCHANDILNGRSFIGDELTNENTLPVHACLYVNG
jgi:hypothetical protein